MVQQNSHTHTAIRRKLKLWLTGQIPVASSFLYLCLVMLEHTRWQVVATSQGDVAATNCFVCTGELHIFSKNCLCNRTLSLQQVIQNQISFNLCESLQWQNSVEETKISQKFSSTHEAVFSSFSGILHFLMTTHLEFMRKYFQAKWSGQNTWRPLQPSKFFFS